MSPNYGKRPAPARHRVPDWLLGGNRKRVVLQALLDPGGCGADELAKTLDIGRATVFETIRALRDLDAVVAVPGGGWRIATELPLGAAIAELLSVLMPLEDRVVARPPRARDQG